ncbi:MAG: alpha/beta hydrolase [Archaeoglobi archaeon]|nr:alpha/beta hydrolase [Candidatus Mnemosynella bozhongmuii]
MELKIGNLRAFLQEAGERCVVMCPPHPLMGGSSADFRLKRIADELQRNEISSLRMDYREDFSGGKGEIEDMRKVVEFAKKKFSELAVLGYSFGAVVASHSDVPQILVSPLVRIDEISLRVDGDEDKYVVFGLRDEFINGEELERVLRAGRNVRRIVKLDTDHFYTGALEELVETVLSFTQEIFS